MEPLERFYKWVAPFYDMRANDSFLLKATNGSPTLESLVQAAKGLSNVLGVKGTQYPESASTAGRNLAMEAALPQALAQEREQLIEEIRDGKSTFSVRTPWGNRKVYDSETGHEVQFSSAGGRKSNGLNSWWVNASQQDIRDLHEQVVAQRQLAAMSPKDLRATISPVRKQQFEQSSVSLQPQINYVLVNPETNREFTRVELLSFLNGGKGNASRILVHPSSKQIIPAAVQRLREIIGVKS